MPYNIPMRKKCVNNQIATFHKCWKVAILMHQKRFEHPTHGTILGLPGLFGNINLFADFHRVSNDFGAQLLCDACRWAQTLLGALR